MDKIKYRLVFKGQIVEGEKIDEVKNKLANALKMDISKIENLFSGEKKIIKKDSDLQTCEQIKAVFEKSGAICFLEQQDTPSPHQEPLPPPLPPQLPGKQKANSSEINDSRRIRGNDEMFCESCGEIIKTNVLACPYCGRTKKKAGLGCVPIGAIVLGIGLFFMAIVGILAAIAVPQFAAYRNRSFEATIKYELNNLFIAEKAYYKKHLTYTGRIADLDFNQKNQEVSIIIVSADENCFKAEGKHNKYSKELWVDCNGVKESNSRGHPK